MKRKTGEQLLRDFAAEDARDMRLYARKLKDNSGITFYRVMETYHRGRYNGYKQALNIVNNEFLWRDE